MCVRTYFLYIHVKTQEQIFTHIYVCRNVYVRKFVFLEYVYTSRGANMRTKKFPVHTCENSSASVYTFVYVQKVCAYVHLYF